MARYCNHSGCELAIAKRRLDGKTCPECGYALLSRHSPLRYIVLSALFSLLFLMFARMCGPEHQGAENPTPTRLKYRPNTTDQQGTVASTLPSKPLPQSKAQPGVDIRGAAQGLADTVKLSQGQSAAFLAAALSRRGTTSEVKDPKLLAAVIYRWVATNISYDVESLNPRAWAPQDPDRVLRDRKAVCEGYACLSEFLLSQNNIECRIVHGIARTDATKIGSLPSVEMDGHAWLIVKWESRWHLLEPTWGSGAVNARKFEQSFTWDWFDADPEIAIYSHIPEQDEMQLLRSSVSVSQIQQAASLSRDFFKAVDLPPLPLISGSVTQSYNASALAWKLRPGFRIAADAVLVGGGEKQTAQVFTLPSGVTELRFPGLLSGTYTVRIFAGETGQKTLQQCGYFQLKQMGTSTTARPPALFRGYHELGVRLCVPVVADLVSGSWQKFSLNADPGLTFGLQFDGETTMEYLSFNDGVYENRVFLHPGKLRLWQVENKKMNCLAEFEVN